MTRGGPRKGAGRPEVERETKSTNLCGVRVTPSQLARYREAAWISNMSMSQWVVNRLDKAVAEVVDLIAVAFEKGPTLTERVAAVGSKGSTTTERYDKPKKRKGKK